MTKELKRARQILKQVNKLGDEFRDIYRKTSDDEKEGLMLILCTSHDGVKGSSQVVGSRGKITQTLFDIMKEVD